MTTKEDEVFSAVFEHGAKRAGHLLGLKLNTVYKKMNRAGIDLRAWQRSATKLKKKAKVS